MTDDDRVYRENVAGYGFLLMVVFILMAISPFIVIIPVTIFYTIRAFNFIRFRFPFSNRGGFVIW